MIRQFLIHIAIIFQTRESTITCVGVTLNNKLVVLDLKQTNINFVYSDKNFSPVTTSLGKKLT